MDLMEHAGVYTDEFTSKQIGAAFALGKEVRPDETSSWRHMELNFSEYLVALAAVVYVKSGIAYREESLADSIDMLFCERLEQAHKKILDVSSRKGARKSRDVTLAPAVAFF